MSYYAFRDAGGIIFPRKSFLGFLVIVIIVPVLVYFYFSGISPSTPKIADTRKKTTPTVEELRKSLYFRKKTLAEPPRNTPSIIERSSRTVTFSRLDKTLIKRLKKHNIEPLAPPKEYSKEKIRLGRWLFWEKELSGERRVACFSCHNTVLGTSDGLSLAVGSGAKGETVGRVPKEPDDFVPRNSPALFNRAQSEWETMFWDMRVRAKDDRIMTPAGKKLPTSIKSVLEAQALFPLSTNKEFRGHPSSRDIFGRQNKLADIEDTAYRKIWGELINRLMKYEEYRRYFKQVYNRQPEKVNISHLADAISAFEEVAFTLRDSPWDRYLAGDTQVLSNKTKRGGILFYGKARCWECHSGKLMTDQKPHNIGIPQIGPGVYPDKPYDLGSYRVTGKSRHRFAFGTPSLRNVSVTGPWMHNGAYKSLEGAVRHHLNPREALKNYNSSQLGRDIQLYHRSPNWIGQLKQFPVGPPGTILQKTVKDKPKNHRRILRTLDPLLRDPIQLSDREIDQLMSFLISLTSPKLIMERYRGQEGKNANLVQEDRKNTARMTSYMTSITPGSVPSGIPLECFNEWCR